MVSDHKLASLRTRPENLFILIKGFFHGCFKCLDRVHLLLESFHVADGLKTHIGSLEPSQTDTITAIARGQLITKSHGCSHIPLLCVEQDHEIQGFCKLDHIALGLTGNASHLVDRRDFCHQLQPGDYLFH